MIWLFWLLCFAYLITGVVAHIIDIYNFFSERNNTDTYAEYKKKLNG